MNDLNFGMKIEHGIEKIGSHGQSGSRYVFQPVRRKGNARLNNFRVGEILQGKILNATGDGQGLVRLPSGDFICMLHKGLLSGDELFFKITDVEPSLVLKVHAVQSHFQRKKRKREDIVRILDLPNADLFLFTSDMYVTFKNMIYKDDLLNFYKFYQKVPNSENYDAESIARALFWLTESGIPFEFDIFQAAYKYFDGLKNIDFYIRKLFFEIFPKLSTNVQNILLPYKSSYFNLNKNTFPNIDYFSNNLKNSDSFYHIMKTISNLKLYELFQGIPIRIVEFIDSMNFWNSICTGSEAAYHWTFPIKNEGKIMAVTFVMSSQFNVRRMLGINSGNYEEIDVGNIIHIMLSRHSSEITTSLSGIRSLSQLPEIFEKFLSDNGLNLLAIHYFDGENVKTIESISGAVIATNRSISFVV